MTELYGTSHNHNKGCQCGSHEENENNFIRIVTHESSIVGSFKISIERNHQQSEVVLENCLKEIARRVIDIGGIIGHVKAVIKETRSFMISITEEESSKRNIDAGSSTMEGVAIVFGISPKQLEHILNKEFTILR